MSSEDPDHRATVWPRLLGLTTLVFTVWYATFLHRRRLPSLLAAGFRRVHGVVRVVPVPEADAFRRPVAVVVGWGLPLSVVLLFVAFALFHRASADVRTAE